MWGTEFSDEGGPATRSAASERLRSSSPESSPTEAT